MFIIKEDVKTIFRRLDKLEGIQSRQTEEIDRLKKESTCNHGYFRGAKVQLLRGVVYQRVCEDCGKVMGTVSATDYHQLEASYHTRLSDKAQAAEKYEVNKP